LAQAVRRVTMVAYRAPCVTPLIEVEGDRAQA
jgi:hypothetical protein